eukprot:15367176-Ditylum_brightwellii.AAC.1
MTYNPWNTVLTTAVGTNQNPCRTFGQMGFLFLPLYIETAEKGHSPPPMIGASPEASQTASVEYPDEQSKASN